MKSIFYNKMLCPNDENEFQSERSRLYRIANELKLVFFIRGICSVIVEEIVKLKSLSEFVKKMKRSSNSKGETFDIRSMAGLCLISSNSAFFKRR